MYSNYPQMYLHEIPQLKTPRPAESKYAPQGGTYFHNTSFLPSYHGLSYDSYGIQDLPPIGIQHIHPSVYPKSSKKSLIPQSLKSFQSTQPSYIYDVPDTSIKRVAKPQKVITDDKKWPFGSESESSLASDGMYGYFTADDEKSIGTQSIASNASAEVYSILYESELRRAERERRRKSPFTKTIRQAKPSIIDNQKSKNIGLIADQMRQAKQQKQEIQKEQDLKLHIHEQKKSFDLKKDLEEFLPKLNNSSRQESKKLIESDKQLENNSIPVYSWSNSTKPLELKAWSFYSQTNPKTGKFELVSPSTYQLHTKELLDFQTKLNEEQPSKAVPSTMFTKIKEEKSSLGLELQRKILNDGDMSSVDSGVGTSLSPKKLSSLTKNHEALTRANSNVSSKTEDSGVDMKFESKRLNFNEKPKGTTTIQQKIPVFKRRDFVASHNSSISSAPRPISTTTSTQRTLSNIPTKIPLLVISTKPVIKQELIKYSNFTVQKQPESTKESIIATSRKAPIPSQQDKKSIQSSSQKTTIPSATKQPASKRPTLSTNNNLNKNIANTKPITNIQTKKVPLSSGSTARTKVVVKPALAVVKLRIEPKYNDILVRKQNLLVAKTPLNLKQDSSKPLNTLIRPSFPLKKSTKSINLNTSTHLAVNKINSNAQNSFLKKTTINKPLIGQTKQLPLFKFR